MKKNAVILGAGVMGSAMCAPFVERGVDVRLVGTHLDRAIIESVRATGLHPKLKVKLPEVSAYHHDELALALKDADFILLGVSSAGVAWAIERLASVLKRPIPIVMITKGLQPLSAGLGALPDQVGAALGVPVAAIGGPCIAGELAVKRPTGTVIVSRDLALARKFADAFSCDYYFPETSDDMMGVEICAAFKNFYAIAVGWAHGQNEVLAETSNAARNNNAAAILFDQAIREMMALVLAHGGQASSVWGMPGAGDLYVTCQAGRNSRLGHALGRGLTYTQAMEGPLQGETVEGAETGRATASSVYGMISAGTLKREQLPLGLALLETLVEGKVFSPPWQAFHKA
jgi:glycerol-3-phosphate dehydrogenase (NAD(P)+)